LIVIADEVRDALDSDRPVVALESTLIAHGLPFPDNLEVGRALEQAVRAQGAVPATVAVLDGDALIGLSPAALERVAQGGSSLHKAGAADLAVIMARRQDGATTVSGTALLAARAGIRVFATGGIGGVHRGGAGDVSSDLSVLARTPIAVVSAGAKAILDLPATVETLESLAVPILGYQTDEFPAFYTRLSGIALEHRVDSPEEVADILRRRFGGLDQGGVLVANPIPPEHAPDPDLIDRAVADALAAADADGVTGKAITPFLLSHIAASTGGVAVGANRALAEANATLAARIAAALPRVVL